MSEISKRAIKWVKENSSNLIKKYADTDEYSSTDKPECFIMAGSPGAGKTEFSIKFLETLHQVNPDYKYVRIDADDIKEDILGYDGKNAAEIHGASALGVQKLIDAVFKRRRNFLLDGTLSNIANARKNISRALSKGYYVTILYLYLDPKEAWDYTKVREEKKGRVIPKGEFIDCFLMAYENIRLLKKEFGENINIDLIVKNKHNKIKTFKINVDNIEPYLTMPYTRDSLWNIL
jgi:UDP-N-acetylglucosamine kinase